MEKRKIMSRILELKRDLGCHCPFLPGGSRPTWFDGKVCKDWEKANK